MEMGAILTLDQSGSWETHTGLLLNTNKNWAKFLLECVSDQCEQHVLHGIQLSDLGHFHTLSAFFAIPFQNPYIHTRTLDTRLDIRHNCVPRQSHLKNTNRRAAMKEVSGWR